jgi:hypothetical protein
MRRSYQYSINQEKKAMMLSLAFDMTPNIAPPRDTTQMSSLPLKEKVFPTEVECAIKLTESVKNIKDVDKLLDSDNGLKNKLKSNAADLLAMAGFDKKAYLRWVDEGETTLAKG